MPILTLKHCLICYKEVGASGSSTQTIKKEPDSDPNAVTVKLEKRTDDTMNFASNRKALNRNKNSEICRRFGTLVSRYFNLEPAFFKPWRTLNSKWLVNIDQACDSCAERLSSFCDIYMNWRYLSMQLDYRALEIVQVMNEADDPSSENAQHKEILTKKMEDNGLTMEDIEDFRTEFKEKVEADKKYSYPLLQMERESKDIFEPIPSKKKKSTPGTSCQQGEDPATQPKKESVHKTKTPPPKKRSRRDSSASSNKPGSECSLSSEDSSLEDLFRPIYKPVKKKNQSKEEKRIPPAKVTKTSTSPPFRIPDPVSSDDSEEIIVLGSKNNVKPLGSVANSSDQGMSSMCGDYIYTDSEED